MKVSVIVPVYNVEAYLNEFMNSVLAQDYSDFEIILIDDCSSDNSSAICDSYAQKYPFCKTLHHNVNKGVGEARNTALEYASGEYITFADPDDVLEKNYISSLVNAAVKNNADLVIGGYINEYIEDGVVLKTNVAECTCGALNDDAAEVLSDLYRKAFLSKIAFKLYRADIIFENIIKFPSIVICEDLLFNFEYYKHISTIVTVSKPIYRYRKYLTGRKTATASYHDSLEIYSIAAMILESGHSLVDSLINNGCSLYAANKLKLYIAEHYLLFTFKCILDMVYSNYGIIKKYKIIRYISDDYKKNQNKAVASVLIRGIDKYFHFLLKHRLNVILLLNVLIYRIKRGK